MKVTVVILSYGYAEYLADALDSVLAQAAPEDGYDVLVVHRGSGDGSEAILERYALADSRITVLEQTGTGIGQAANQGIAAARGEYVLRLDADDLLLPDALRTLADALDAAPSASFAYGDYYYLMPTGEKLRKGLPAFDAEELCERGDFLAGGTLFRKSLFDEVGGLDETLPTLDNYDLILRLMEAGVVGVHVEMPIFCYRIHGASMSDETELVRTTGEQIAASHGRAYTTNENHPRMVPR